jgi:hypothetical protein
MFRATAPPIAAEQARRAAAPQGCMSSSEVVLTFPSKSKFLFAAEHYVGEQSFLDSRGFSG